LANIAKAKTEVDVQLLNSGRHLQNTEDVIGQLRLDLKNLETKDRNFIANLEQDIKFLTQEKELLLKRLDLKNLETKDRNVIANLEQDVKFLTQEKELLLKRISESANF
jgi:predicted transposase YbfD/YdcC